MSQDVQAVLLDLDGTLIDAFAPIVRAMGETLAAFDLPAMSELEIRRHTGKGDCSMRALFGDKQDEAAAYFVRVHDETYLNDITPMPGALNLLRWLKAHEIPAAVVTSKGQQRAVAQLEKLGWTHYFKSVVGKVDGRASKPNPEPLLLACVDLLVDASHAVMVGDGVADMKAASRAGCMGIGLTHVFDEAELQEAGASLCFASLSEVQAWLQT